MRRLVLMRHGKAEPATGGQRDIDRPLAPRGVWEARRVAEALADLGFAPDALLVSAARRTRETAESVLTVFPGAKATYEPALYQSSAGQTLARVAEAGDAACLWIIGHNPTQHEAALTLLGAGGGGAAAVRALSDGFPTSAAAAFEAGDRGLALRRLLTPKTAPKPATVFKLLPRSEWEAAQAAGAFAGSAVDLADGFIHFSTAGQVAETARRHFAGQGDLLRLTVSTAGLDLRYEPSRGGDLFPHLYGPLPLAAVTAADAFAAPAA